MLLSNLIKCGLLERIARTVIGEKLPSGITAVARSADKRAL